MTARTESIRWCHEFSTSSEGRSMRHIQRFALPSLNSLTHSSRANCAGIDVQIAVMNFRGALIIFEKPRGIGADHPDMYIAKAVWINYFLNWAVVQAQTMRGSRI